jgi:hypothetical protein
LQPFEKVEIKLGIVIYVTINLILCNMKTPALPSPTQYFASSLSSLEDNRFGVHLDSFASNTLFSCQRVDWDVPHSVLSS